jgi:hypothetical protein
MRTLIVCLLAAATAFAAPAEKMENAGGCPGGYAEGAEIERGRLVYVCQGGNVVPKGCIAEDLSKIAVGANFDTKNYRRTCALQGSDLTFEPVACLQNGQERKPGDTFEDGTQFYSCEAGDAQAPLKIVPKGCVEGGKRVNAKDTVPKGDVLYSCQPAANGQFKLAPAGCVKDGKQLKAGDTIEDGKFWYNCSVYGRNTVELKTGGCVSGGKRLNDGDRFVENDVAYECMIDSVTKGVRVTACMQNENGQVIERKVGCYFNQGQEPFQYEMRCLGDEATKTAKPVFIRCNYKSGGGNYGVDPGCYRNADKDIVGCLKNGDALKLQLFQGDNAKSSAESAGLKNC